MSLDLRARAAIATLEVFGFNPHQRRGPDGKFIKMADHELKRPRRPRRPKAPKAPTEDRLYRQRRERFNDEIIRDAIEQRDGFANPAMHPELDQIEGMPPGPERDALVDRMMERINDRIPDESDRYVPPALGAGPRVVERPESPLYRARREEFNVDVLNHARSDRRIYKDEDQKPEKYALLDQAEAMQPGPERDAVIDRLTEIINSGGTIMEPYIPPTTGGPEYTQAVGGGQRPSIDAPYAERRAALQASIDTGAHAEETLAQGAMGETRRFELADGTSAIYKRHTRDWNRGRDYPTWTKTDQTDAEELSAITAEALGVKAPAVTRASDTEIYMELMPGQIGEMRWPHRNTPPKGVVVGQQGVRMGLLDTLIENTDRHGGNYLVDEDENLYAIDHGLAFSKTYEKLPDGTVQRKPVDRFNATGEFALGNFVSPSGNLYDNPLTPADGQKLKRVMADLRDQFEQHGRLGWWEAMNERAQHIAARASGTQDVL